MVILPSRVLAVWLFVSLMAISHAASTLSLLSPRVAPRSFAGVESDLVHVVTGYGKVAGIRADGKVRMWRLDNGDEIHSSFIAGLSNVRQLAITTDAIVALLADGSIRGEGTVQNPDKWSQQISADPVYGVPHLVDICAGAHGFIGLTSEGRVFSRGDVSRELSAAAAAAENLVRLAPRGGALFAFKADGTPVYRFYNTALERQMPSDLTGVISWASTTTTVLALKNDGTVIGWGSDAARYVERFEGRSDLVALYAAEGEFFAATTAGDILGHAVDGATTRLSAPILYATEVNEHGINDGLLVLHTQVPPTLAAQTNPAGHTLLLEGQVLELWARGEGVGLSFQWFRGETPVPSAHEEVLRIDSVTTADAGDYRLRISNGAGEVWSVPVTVVVTPGVIPVQRVILVPGETLHLSATIPDAVSFNWRHQGRLLSAADSPVYEKTAVKLGDTGAYTLEATLANGDVVRATSFVHVVPPVRSLAAWSRSWGYGPLTRLDLEIEDSISVVVGYNFLTAVKADGSVLRHPDSDSVPHDLTDAVSLWVGYGALRADGTIRTWGVGSPRVPGLMGVVDVVSSYDSYLALKNDGSVVAWDLEYDGVRVLTPPGCRVVSLNPAYGLCEDGSVLVWAEEDSALGLLLSTLEGVIEILPVPGGYLVRQADGTLLRLGEAAEPPEGELPAAWHRFSDATILRSRTGELSGAEFLPGVVTSGVFASAANETLFAAIYALPLASISDVPAEMTVIDGQRAVLGAEVAGEFLQYRWEKDGKPVPGADRPVLILERADARSAGVYQLIVSNPAGEVRATATRLTVLAGSVPPSDVLAKEGNRVALTTKVDGATGWQWHKNGQPIAGATGASLVFGKVRPSDAGSYVVEIQLPGKTVRAVTFVAVTNPAWDVLALGAVPVKLPRPAAGWAGLGALPIAADGRVFYGSDWLPGLADVVQIGQGAHVLFKNGSVGWRAPGSDNEAFHGEIPLAARSEVIGLVSGVALKADGTRVRLEPGDYDINAATLADFFPDVRPTGTSDEIIKELEEPFFSGTRVALRNDGTLTVSGRDAAGLAELTRISGVVSLQGGVIIYHSRAPRIVRQPEDVVSTRDTAIFSVEVANGPVSYQWLKNGKAIPEATGPEYQLSWQPGAGGAFSVRVSNGAGSVTSRAARLTMALPNPFPALAQTRFGEEEFYWHLDGLSLSGPKLFVRGLPPGLVFDPTEGTVQGFATRPGTYKITYGYAASAAEPGWSTTVTLRVANWVSGAFEGLVWSEDDRVISGKVALLVALDGSFTGTFTSDADPNPLPLRGRITETDDAVSLVLSRGRRLVFTLNENSEGVVRLFDGSVELGGGALKALRTYAGKGADLAPWSGPESVHYTAVLNEPESFVPEDARPFPKGSGHLEIVAAPNGVLSLKGSLADGYPVTASLSPGADASFNWFTKLSTPGGYLGRVFQFEQAEDEGWVVPSWQRRIFWRKPVSASDRVADYPAGFGVFTTLQMARWDAPLSAAGSPTLAELMGIGLEENLSVRLTGDDFALALDDMRLDARRAAFVSGDASPNIGKYSLKLDAKTGRISGWISSSLLPVGIDSDKRRWTVEGAAFQPGEYEAAPLAEGFILPPKDAASKQEGAGAIRIILNDSGE